jgi:hypothetical protein
VKGDDVACAQFAIPVKECLADLAGVAGVSEAANIINTSLRQKDRVVAGGPKLMRYGIEQGIVTSKM